MPKEVSDRHESRIGMASSRRRRPRVLEWSVNRGGSVVAAVMQQFSGQLSGRHLIKWFYQWSVVRVSESWSGTVRIFSQTVS